jgi:small GTP-binding protein
MIQKKICMLGGFAVGKTSLVSQFVSSIFSEKYLTTVGVKIDKKSVSVNEEEVTLMLWDIYGQDELQTVQQSYLRGCSGYLLVIDGTRVATADAAVRLHETARQAVGEVPFVVVLNKVDLRDQWQIDERGLWKLAERGAPIVQTSAKTGEGVEKTFTTLARAMIGA